MQNNRHVFQCVYQSSLLKCWNGFIDQGPTQFCPGQKAVDNGVPGTQLLEFFLQLWLKTTES